jgi:hypothetical protein
MFTNPFLKEKESDGPIIPRQIASAQLLLGSLPRNNPGMHSSPRIVQTVANGWPRAGETHKVAPSQQIVSGQNA